MILEQDRARFQSLELRTDRAKNRLFVPLHVNLDEIHSLELSKKESGIDRRYKQITIITDFRCPAVSLVDPKAQVCFPVRERHAMDLRPRAERLHIFLKQFDDAWLRLNANDARPLYKLQKTCRDISDVGADIDHDIARSGSIEEDLNDRTVEFAREENVSTNQIICAHMDVKIVAGSCQTFAGTKVDVATEPVQNPPRAICERPVARGKSG
ncbi:hypothetical protein ATE67_15685 [Sphingopyxis sp. H050]|nr:hypothetical protein ATE67_15685 [Sphingopyxis sp. H050]